MPTFNNAIPQPTDNPSQSQDQLLQNFQVLYTAFEQDHVPYNSATEGQHAQITFPVGPLTGQPFTYLSGQIGLQSLNQSPTSRPDIWMSRGTATAIPITGYAVGSVVGPVAAAAWTYLPSGFLKIGGFYETTAGVAAIDFNNTAAGGLTGFPGFSTFIYNIQITKSNTDTTTSIQVTSIGLTGFDVGLYAGSEDTPFFWSAEGM